MSATEAQLADAHRTIELQSDVVRHLDELLTEAKAERDKAVQAMSVLDSAAAALVREVDYLRAVLARHQIEVDA